MFSSQSLRAAAAVAWAFVTLAASAQPPGPPPARSPRDAAQVDVTGNWVAQITEYLRKNGVPYSERAVVTEYYDRFAMFGNDYLQGVTIVDDPTYLTTPFVVSNHFKREPDD